MISLAQATFAQARAQGNALQHRLHQVLQKGRFLTAIVIAFMFLYMISAYLLVSQGLLFVHRIPLMGAVLTERMLFLLFFFFFIMLILSNAAITGISLFRRQETGWHLSLPMPHGSVVLWRTIEGLLLSSWGLLLLSAPILAGFGQAFRADALFYVVSIPAILCLIALASNASTWLLLLVVRFYKPLWLKLAGIILVALGVVILLQLRDSQETKIVGSDVATNVNQILRHTEICTHPLLPSSWVAEAMINAAKGQPQKAIFYNLLLLSYGLVVWPLTIWLSGKLFYATWNRALHRAEINRAAASAATFGKRSDRSNVLRNLGLRRYTRALILKDAYTFLREPMQWGQCALIFGLLLLYTSNLRHLGYGVNDDRWTPIISYLNLIVCCLALSTLTTRFVFPQFSLEGQRLWILGLAPFPLSKVLHQKLGLNLAATLPMTSILVTISCFSLKLPSHRIVFFVSAIILLTIGLNTLALALGTLIPNFKETNSAKIVSGFGGTLCLVLSFFYIVASIAILVIPTIMERKSVNSMTLEKLYSLEALSIMALFILTVVASGLPYFFALKRTKRLANLGNP